MEKSNHQNYPLTRGLGSLFIFAGFMLLENNDFLWMFITIAIGGLNMLTQPWQNRILSMGLYAINVGASAVVFYLFVQMDTQYMQWLWLALLIFYVVRLRDLWNTKQPETEHPE